MILYYFPISPGIRNTVLVAENIFTKNTGGKPPKNLLRSIAGAVGRRGKVLCRHRGGGHKRLYRKIDFQRKKIYESGRVRAIINDPNRSSYIALVDYPNNEKAYILAPHGITVGTRLSAGFCEQIANGNSLPLWNIPLGTNVYNVEFYPGSGGQLSRSAGTFSQLLARENGFVTLRLPSGQRRLLSQLCWATIGQRSNPSKRNITLGKAGRIRWLGRRPRVRGRAINPVEHAHGGGEGRRPIGRPYPCTPWGKPRLGVKTRRSHKYSTAFICR